MRENTVQDGLSTEQLLDISKALGDPKRIEMLRILAQIRDASCCASASNDAPEGGICVCEVVKQTGLIQSLVSYHMKILKEAGLVREQVCGKWNYYSLDRDTVHGYLKTLSKLLLSTRNVG
ncbi:MAG: ArsR/SmtB family transcription factor [Syntrophothermus sp.]